MVVGIACNALNVSKKTGVERYVDALLRAMMTTPLGEGDRVRLYVAKKPIDFPTLPAGWEWRELPFALPKGWTHVRLSWELWRHPPDVLFTPAHEIPRYVPKKTRVVATVHDVAFRRVRGVYAPGAIKRQEWAIRRAVTRATVLLAVSEATKQDLCDVYRVAPERVAVTLLAVDATRYGVDQATLVQTLARYRLTQGRYVLFVGRLEAKKNVVTLVRAFAALKHALGVGHPLELLLVGGWGYGEERIRRAIAAHPEGIRVAGFVPDDDLPALYAGALSFCFPSLYEGFGLPVLEAFAAGAPVIASDIAALREVVGDAALLCAPTETPAWTDAMRRMLFEPDLRAMLVEKGKNRLAAYDWQKTAEGTWRAIRDVVQTGKDCFVGRTSSQ